MNRHVMVSEYTSLGPANGFRWDLAAVVDGSLNLAGGAFPLAIVSSIPFDNGERVGNPASFISPQFHRLPPCGFHFRKHLACREE
jgi:hypothetical protein